MCYNSKVMTNKTKGIICIVVSAFGFALMGACVRLADNFGTLINPMQKSLFRNLVAVVIAGAVYVRTRRQRSNAFSPTKLRAREWWLLIARAVFGTIGIVTNFYALSHIAVAEALTLNKLAPFFTVLFTALFLRERFTWHQLGAILLAFVGGVFIVKPFGGTAVSLVAAASGLVSGVCAGAAYTAVRALGRDGKVDGAFIILFFSAFSTLVLIPFMGWRYDAMSAIQVLILFGAGAAAALGQFGITWAYRLAPPAQIAIFDYTNPIFAALLGYCWFGQILDLYSCFGIALIIAGALFSHARRCRA